MHVQLPGIKVQLAIAYAISHLLFGCIIWGHCFGIQLHLHGTGGTCSSVGKLETLNRALLRWVLAIPRSTHGTSLYLFIVMLPLHGFNIKATVRYFGGLECDKCRFDEADDTQHGDLQIHYGGQQTLYKQW